jgi:hypothetical protein
MNENYQLNEHHDQLQEVLIKLQASEERHKLCEEQIANFHDNLTLRSEIVQNNEENEDIVVEITSGDQIQLESFKSIPEFSGVRGTYRSWKNQVARRMKTINAFKKHPKYEAALGIIRSKITGAASNVLINNKTAYNIISILKTLDSSYADKRPLYVVEAEMTSINQLNKNLQEHHDAINEALNLVISKITLDYKLEAEQKSLVTEAQRKAVRTFIVGLRSQMMRNILYGRKPESLGDTFGIAQTVYYDYQYTESQENHSQQRQNSSKFNSNANFNRPMQISTQLRFNNKPEYKPVTMNENKQENWRQLKQSTMNENKRENWRQQNQQQPNRVQKINQIQESESISNNDNDEDLCDTIPDDLISNITHESDTASAFLSE